MQSNSSINSTALYSSNLDGVYGVAYESRHEACHGAGHDVVPDSLQRGHVDVQFIACGRHNYCRLLNMPISAPGGGVGGRRVDSVVSRVV
jgi:hypothetical protein